MQVRVVALAIAVAVTACTTAQPLPLTTPSPSVAAASPSVARSPSPSVTPVAGPPLVATAIGRVPPAFHYLESGSGASYRLLLFDEAAVAPPVEVAHGGPLPLPAGPDVRSNAFSASADGRIVVVMVRESEQRTTYFVLRPETGELRALLSGADLGSPVITPDGGRIAYARTSADAQANGVWLAAVGDAAPPAPTRIVVDDPQRVGSPPRPLAWSADAKWLAISPSPGESATFIAIVDPTGGPARFDAATVTLVGGRARVIGEGYAIDWRGGEGNVLITSTRTLFGGRSAVYAADVNSGAIRSLYRAGSDVVLRPAAWHPALDRFALTERPLCCGAYISEPAWVRRIDGSATNVGDAGGDLWWSKDGARLLTTTGGDDSVGAIRDLLSGRAIVQYCKRSQGSPPGCT